MSERDLQRGVVWIVEDSALEAEMARRALAPTQDIEVISDGSIALERFAAGSVPDAIVLDWQLPTVNGVEVCRIMRATHDANVLPILMVTVPEQKQDIAFALEAGANDYLAKPYDVTELVARVHTLVRTSRLQRAQLRRSRQLELAAEVGAALTRARSSEELTRRCADVIATRLDATFAGIWLTHSAGNELVAQVARDRGPNPQLLVDEVVLARQTLTDPTFAAVPLILRDEVMGVLAVHPRGPIADATSDLQTIADLVALGIARVRAEEERSVILERERRARAEAEAANRSKDEFLAVVSHELRTPLNAITGWAGMLTSGTLDAARTKRALETIERNARAQAQLIEDLMDVTRITSGKLHLAKGNVDVSSVAEMALESVRLAGEAKGIVLTSDIASNVPIVVGDADRIQQVVWNLLSNAIKFTPADGEVSIAVAHVPQGVRIVVRDSGQGISPEFLPFVFDRFRQADGSATRAASGLGLGLAIVRHLVELHGGKVEAESKGLKMGSTFIVSLPALGDVSPARAATGKYTRVMMDRPALRGLRVLVVDDEPDARDVVRALLETQGVHVTAAASATEAFEALRTEKPDVILSDIAMPGEDGLTFMRRVRRLSSEDGGATPSIALTAYARLEDRANALRAGFNDHLAKPVDANELFTILAGLAS